MAREILHIAAMVAGALMLCAIGYYAACLFAALRFLRRRRVARKVEGDLPPVSILKPLKGTDPRMYESFRSHCLQDYPNFEIVFGVSEADDPAIVEVERLKQEFPERRIKLVVCGKNLGANTKVSNLVQMLSSCTHEFLVVNDSDIRVDGNYLQQVIAPLLDDTIGMVTCLYRGLAAETLGSRIEALGISTDFVPGVLVAGELQGIGFGLGSTMALRRGDLERMGGFQPLLNYLADDYELGSRIAGLGLAVELSESVVATFLPRYSVREFFQHQLRWMRTIRGSRPAGYAGLVFTFGIFWGLVALAASGAAAWAGVALAVTAGLRVSVAIVVGKNILQDPDVVRSLWLIPLRDLVAPLVWLAGLAGHTIHWRGNVFRLKAGLLEKIEH
jgi:ceramide glucosyltransferase